MCMNHPVFTFVLSHILVTPKAVKYIAQPSYLYRSSRCCILLLAKMREELYKNINELFQLPSFPDLETCLGQLTIHGLLIQNEYTDLKKSSPHDINIVSPVKY